MKAGAWAVAAGGMFGAGLVVSGMTDPRNVLGFLDVAGAWNPALAAVMAAAIGVHGLSLWVARGRAVAPADAQPPPGGRPDARLVVGAALFGAGWGLAGYCPGPAVVSAAWSLDALLFVVAMLTGMTLVHLGDRAGLTTARRVAAAH